MALMSCTWSLIYSWTRFTSYSSDIIIDWDSAFILEFLRWRCGGCSFIIKHLVKYSGGVVVKRFKVSYNLEINGLPIVPKIESLPLNIPENWKKKWGK